MTSTIIWGMALLIYQSLQFAKTMRYLIFIYPLLAVFAAVGFSFMYSKIKRISALSAVSIGIGVFICVMIWPVAFMSIYTKPHSRVAASKWIYKTVPYGSTLLTEYWDDPLPLMVYDPRSKNYIGREVHIFDPDSSEKWKEINTQLAQADYYIMSSNRGWGSITNASRLYPQASRFYSDMFKGKAGYTLIKKFSSYPSLRYLGIPLDFPDQSSEEAFTVYDHPEVMIFKKN